MGRNFGVGHLQIQSSHYHNHNHHPIIAWSFFIACIAATIAIVSSLCGLLSRRRSSAAAAAAASPSSSADKNEKIVDTNNGDHQDSTVLDPSPAEGTTSVTAAEAEAGDNKDEDYLKQPLPPPPAMRAASYHFRSASQGVGGGGGGGGGGKLTWSMSMGVTGGGGSGLLKSVRQASRRETKRDKKHEDSLWKKTIILGEKCRVPDEEDEGILYDEKGHRISAYQKRMPGSSRQGSCIDPVAVP